MDDAERFNEESRRLNPQTLTRKLVYTPWLLDRSPLDAAIWTRRCSCSTKQRTMRSGVWCAMGAYAGLAMPPIARKKPALASRYLSSAQPHRTDTIGFAQDRLQVSYLNGLIRFYQQ